MLVKNYSEDRARKGFGWYNQEVALAKAVFILERLGKLHLLPLEVQGAKKMSGLHGHHIMPGTLSSARAYTP